MNTLEELYGPEDPRFYADPTCVFSKAELAQYTEDHHPPLSRLLRNLAQRIFAFVF